MVPKENNPVQGGGGGGDAKSTEAVTSDAEVVVTEKEIEKAEDCLEILAGPSLKSEKATVVLGEANLMSTVLTSYVPVSCYASTLIRRAPSS